MPASFVTEVEGDLQQGSHLHSDIVLPATSRVSGCTICNSGGAAQPSSLAPPPLTLQKMVAVFDYKPREDSPNESPDLELTFKVGDIITIYGNMVGCHNMHSSMHGN